MDAMQFDAMTKAWTMLPRRQVLGGLAAGVLGSLLGLGGREGTAQATVCRRGKDCAADQKCTNQICVSTCGDPFTCSSGGGGGCGFSCICAKKPGGGSLCVDGDSECSTLARCRRQSQCPEGTVCATGCCGSFPKFACQAPCDGT